MCGAVLIRVGSRGSRLALTQAESAAARLRAPGIELALVPITTAGDRDRTRPFGEIGSRGVFVKELEEALLDGRVDVAVHSAKDMTSTDASGLSVGAYLRRDDPRDALCGARVLEPGMRVGTASIRRRAQLLALDPSLSIELEEIVMRCLEKDPDHRFQDVAALQRALKEVAFTESWSSDMAAEWWSCNGCPERKKLAAELVEAAAV